MDGVRFVCCVRRDSDIADRKRALRGMLHVGNRHQLDAFPSFSLRSLLDDASKPGNDNTTMGRMAKASFIISLLLLRVRCQSHLRAILIDGTSLVVAFVSRAGLCHFDFSFFTMLLYGRRSNGTEKCESIKSP